MNNYLLTVVATCILLLLFNSDIFQMLIYSGCYFYFIIATIVPICKQISDSGVGLER